MKFYFLGLGIALTALLVSGCGGGSDPINPSAVSATSITGTIATGTGVAADLVAIDSTGRRVTGTSDENGTYSLDTTRMIQPIMIQATIRSSGDLMYSFVSSTGGVLNVTPLTTYVIDQSAIAAGIAGGVSQLFQYFVANATSIISHIPTVTTALNELVAIDMADQNVSGFNHFTGIFRANHVGYDAFLDRLDMEIAQDDVIIRHGATTLDTFDYNITASTISVTGRITNITNDMPINGATITAIDRNGHEVSVTTDSNGTFNMTTETMRRYDINITATGYQTQFFPHISSFQVTNMQIGTIAMVPNGSNVLTTLSGTVIDGRTTNTGINQATLTFRAGYNTRVGTAFATVSTDSNGTYSINTLPAGAYTVEVAKIGYSTEYINIAANGATMSQNFDLIGSVTGSTGRINAFATIVLNWGANPSDLDSHLTGPITNDSRFHVYYVHRLETDTNTASTGITEGPCATPNVVANLDRDDTSSYGPETTTLCRVIPGGLYKYYIHHYSGTSTIAESSASVTLSLANGTTRTFTAPSTGSTGDNDIWHVFNVDANGNVYPINQIIGNGEAFSTLMALSAPILNTNSGAEKSLFLNLPRK